MKLKNGAIWHYLSYRELANELRAISHTVQATNRYHGAIVSDYFEFIEALDDLNRRLNQRAA